ncbi:MAG TPA: Gfo/Idh/MocA family oxidoreductase [Polyangiaceae bacterium]|nr:Gfo/Idh/MocA family oxidoreductase [Polyangiaceae bacterium]
MIVLGLVGCAHCHTPWIVSVLKARKDVKVKAVYDHDRLRAEACAWELRSEVVRDASVIWSDPEIRGVFVLSETNRHESDVLAAARAKKHVFVEKPLGLGAKDAFKMTRALEKAGVIFMTGYRTRSEGIFAFLREQIQRGSFGKVTRIRYINCHGGALQGGFRREHSWMTDPKQAGGGAFLDLGTHALDSLLWLMGEPVVAATSATGSAVSPTGPREGEEFGEGLIKFKSGAIGSLAAARVDLEQPVRCVISGTEGHAHVTSGKLFFKSQRVRGADGKTPWTDLPPDRPLVFDLFVDHLGRRSKNGYITPREAANVCAIQDALAEGARLKRWVKPRWLEL